MRSLLSLVLLTTLAVGSGCTSSATSDEGSGSPSGAFKTVPTVSGARLRAKRVVGGGARELVGFHDSERNEDCTFQPAEEGRVRCLPAVAASVSRGAFADPACQVPAGTRLGCATGPTYAIAYAQDGCGGRSATEIRKVLDTPAARYVPRTSGCTLEPGAPGSPAPVALGEAIPWTAFVEAVEELIPGDPAERILVGSDGTRQHLGFRLEVLDADCTFQVMSDGITRCVPEVPSGRVFYGDSDCSQALFVEDYSGGERCGGAVAKLWLEQEPSSAGSGEDPTAASCGGVRAVYSLGIAEGSSAPVIPEELYSPTASHSCASLGLGRRPSPKRRSIKANITASLPSSARIRSGGERLVPALVAAAAPANGANVNALSPGWHDKERNVDCSFTLASDGKLRCLPAAAPATIFFTDDACTSPSRVAVLGPSASCAGGPGFARVTSQTCPEVTTIYALGTESRDLTNASTETEPGRCPIFTGVNNAFDATVVDPATFVEGTTQVE